MKWLRAGLLVVSLAGILFSGAGLGLTFMDGSRFEDITRSFVEWQVEREVKEFVTPPPAKDGGALAAMRNRLLAEVDVAERMLGSDYAERIAERVARECVCQLDIQDREEKRRRFVAAKDQIATSLRLALRGELAQNGIGIGTLDDLISGYYVETVDGLKRDLRIFFGSNLVLYVIVGLAAFFSTATVALVPPATMLLVGTLVSTGLYLFGQNWLATILFHRWTGYGYLGWVALICLFLADLFLNKARVTYRILSSINWIPVPGC